MQLKYGSQTGLRAFSYQLSVVGKRETDYAVQCSAICGLNALKQVNFNRKFIITDSYGETYSYVENEYVRFALIGVGIDAWE